MAPARFTSTQKTVILTGPEEFTSWLRAVEQSATAEGLWDLISGEEEILLLGTRPARPNPAELRARGKKDGLDAFAIAGTIAELIKDYQLANIAFAKERTVFDRQDERVRKANNLLKNTVHDAILGQITDMGNPHTTFEAITKACQLTDARPLNPFSSTMASMMTAKSCPSRWMWSCSGPSRAYEWSATDTGRNLSTFERG